MATVRSVQIGNCIYLDYNATTPVYPEVARAIHKYLEPECCGNPSSIHIYGRQTKAALSTAREQVARLINAFPDEIIFTSCGTESDHHAIWGTIVRWKRRYPCTTPHVIASEIEHPAVIEYLNLLSEMRLLSWSTVPVDSEGIVNPDSIAQELEHHKGKVALVTIMHSNNEVGSIQPIREISDIIRASKQDILFHSDAAQSIGKVLVDVENLGVDLLTIVGHKFGAPKGIAALYLRKGVGQYGVFLAGGGQENGRRAGTENVAYAVGLGVASEIVMNELPILHPIFERLRSLLEEGLRDRFDIIVHGPADPLRRLPNTLSISLGGIVASSLLTTLKDDVAASAGAACHSVHGGDAVVSKVLEAMDIDKSTALGTLRFSVGRYTTEEEVERAVVLIARAAEFTQ